jgi:hypothetical protein
MFNLSGQRWYPKGTNRACCSFNLTIGCSIFTVTDDRFHAFGRHVFASSFLANHHLGYWHLTVACGHGHLDLLQRFRRVFPSVLCPLSLVLLRFCTSKDTRSLIHDYMRRVNHWLVLITFLQHTDPLLPHYRPPEFTFVRGALSTLDRSLLGDLGPIMGWIGAHATNGISETHVCHHISSKIPHYNALSPCLLAFWF